MMNNVAPEVDGGVLERILANGPLLDPRSTPGCLTGVDLPGSLPNRRITEQLLAMLDEDKKDGAA